MNFTKIVGTNQTNYIFWLFFVVSAELKWKGIILWRSRWGLAWFHKDFLRSPPITHRNFSQTRTNCKHSLPLRAERAGHGQRGPTQEYINTIIILLYKLFSLSRLFHQFLSSSQVGSGFCGWLVLVFRFRRRRHLRSNWGMAWNGFSWRRPRPWRRNW